MRLKVVGKESCRVGSYQDELAESHGTCTACVDRLVLWVSLIGSVHLREEGGHAPSQPAQQGS